jgi:hypothetical protein
VDVQPESWTGVWLAENTSFYGHPSSQALVLRANGTGSAFVSSIFHPERNSYWVKEHYFTWSAASSNTLNGLLGEWVTLSGSGSDGWRIKKSGPFTVQSTALGLAVNAMGLEKARFKKSDLPLNTNLSSMIVADARGRLTMGQGNSNNDALGMMAMGGAIGATYKGNTELARRFLGQVHTLSGGQYGLPAQVSSSASHNKGKFGTQTTDITANYPEGYAYNVTTYAGFYASDDFSFVTMYGLTSYAQAKQNLEAGRSVYGGDKSDRRGWFWIEKVPVNSNSKIRLGTVKVR